MPGYKNKTGGTYGSNQFGAKGTSQASEDELDVPDPDGPDLLSQVNLPPGANSTRMSIPVSSETKAIQIAMASDTPVILWGEPGEGKTATIEDMAKAAGAHLEVIIGSQYEPTDIAGQPWVKDGEDGPEMIRLPPDWAKRIFNLPKDQPSIVFFDELDKCPPAIQNACLRVIRERSMGDKTLPDNCRIVAAANPPESGGAWDLPAPMSNRFMHITWSPSESTVRQGLSTGMWPQAAPIDVDPEKFADAQNNWRGMVGAFLETRPGLTRAMPKDETAQGKPWPSPRTWEMMINAGATWEATGEKKVVRSVIARGVVGEGAANELLSWIDKQDLPSPESVIADPYKAPIGSRGDQVMATTTSVVSALINRTDQQRIDNTLIYLDRVCAAGKADAVLPSAAPLVRTILDPQAKWKLPKEEQITNLIKILRDAHWID